MRKETVPRLRRAVAGIVVAGSIIASDAPSAGALNIIDNFPQDGKDLLPRTGLSWGVINHRNPHVSATIVPPLSRATLRVTTSLTQDNGRAIGITGGGADAQVGNTRIVATASHIADPSGDSNGGIQQRDSVRNHLKGVELIPYPGDNVNRVIERTSRTLRLVSNMPDGNLWAVHPGATDCMNIEANVGRSLLPDMPYQGTPVARNQLNMDQVVYVTDIAAGGVTAYMGRVVGTVQGADGLDMVAMRFAPVNDSYADKVHVSGSPIMTVEEGQLRIAAIVTGSTSIPDDGILLGCQDIIRYNAESFTPAPGARVDASGEAYFPMLPKADIQGPFTSLSGSEGFKPAANCFSKRATVYQRRAR